MTITNPIFQALLNDNTIDTILQFLDKRKAEYNKDFKDEIKLASLIYIYATKIGQIQEDFEKIVELYNKLKAETPQ